jgi:hypothetical protein
VATQSSSESVGTRNARLGDPYCVVVVVVEVVVVVVLEVVLLVVVLVVEVVVLLVLVDVGAEVEVVEDTVVVVGFFSDGTHSSRRWISVTSSSPNWFVIVCVDCGKRPSCVL